MKKIIMLATLLGAFQLLLAQKPPIKFGNIDQKDLMMKYYEKDSNASAVILADYGESEIVYSQNKGFELKFERIRRIKILTKDGYDWANLNIPLYVKANKSEEVNSIKASTFNLEGSKVVETKLEKSQIFREETSENWVQVKLAMPNVKEGSVIDISYRVTSPYLFNFQDWSFQSTIPVVWSEYIARIPDFFSYQKFTQGYIGLFINEHDESNKTISLTGFSRSGGQGTHPVVTTYNTNTVPYKEEFFRWVAKDVPAFVEEPYMASSVDFISSINFELAFIKFPDSPIETIMGTWENINKEFMEHSQFGGVVKHSGFLKDTADKLTSGMTDPKQKIAVLYDYVKNSVEWNGRSRVYADGNFKRTLEEKKGNAAEINLMLVSLLSRAGLTANPVLISTRNHGFIREHIPVASQFNYVIAAVEVEGKDFLLDATDRSLPISVLPERCLNGKGLMISENGPNWIDLTPASKSRKSTNVQLKISEEGELIGKLETTSTGYEAQKSRRTYLAKGETTYLQEAESALLCQISNSSFQHMEVSDESTIESFEVTLPEHTQVAGGTMLINPFISRSFTENPFQLENRIYPVDFASPFDEIYLAKFEIPEGYMVDELPQPKLMALPGNAAKYTYSLSQIGNTINFTSMLSVNRALFVQEEYPHLREFFAQLVAKQSEVIVLKKKE